MTVCLFMFSEGQKSRMAAILFVSGGTRAGFGI
jgi:hypothetical protein